MVTLWEVQALESITSQWRKKLFQNLKTRSLLSKREWNNGISNLTDICYTYSNYMGFLVWLCVIFSVHCLLQFNLFLELYFTGARLSYPWRLILIHQLPRSWVWRNCSRIISPACCLPFVWLFTAQYVLLTSRGDGFILSYPAASCVYTGVFLRADTVYRKRWRMWQVCHIQLVCALIGLIKDEDMLCNTSQLCN